MEAVSNRRQAMFVRKLAILYLFVWIYLAIDPLDRADWLLDNLLVFVFVPLLAITYRRFQFSNTSYLLITLFLILHAVGAHYSYTFTPWGDWLKETLSLSRNHYDRIVHFCFGLLLAYPLKELLDRIAKVPSPWSYLFAPLLIVAFSAIFECIEATVAELVNPDLGIVFLGAQGDIWDAQKDIIVSLYGSVAAMLAAYKAARQG
jgi:putative membrane protein